jgi:hypothetical protein
MKHLSLLSLLLCSIANAQWEQVPEIPGTRVVYSLIAVHDTLYAGTDSLVYVGANAGTHWFAGVPPAASADVVGCMLKAGNVLLAGTFHNGIFRSTNDGLSWQPFSTGLSGLGAMDISSLLVRRDSLIAGTLGAGVFATTADFSHPWASWGDSLADYQGDNVFKMLAVANTVLAGAGANGYMFRYTDAQPWWNPIPTDTPRRVGQIVWGIASGATTVVAGTSTGIYRSTDEGLSWERTSASIPPLTFSISVVYHGSTFFALATTPLSSSLLMSLDEGKTWESLGAFPIPNLLATAIVGETFYLGGDGGLWRAPLSLLVTTVGETSPTPSEFKLQQNYPNPFNPTTTITYNVDQSGQVSLRVFNVIGQEVAALVDGAEVAGHHDVKFDATNFPSGVHFYRLQTGGLTETRRMVLLK